MRTVFTIRLTVVGLLLLMLSIGLGAGTTPRSPQRHYQVVGDQLQISTKLPVALSRGIDSGGVVNSEDMCGGVIDASSPSYAAKGSTGQVAAGYSSSPSFGMSSGFLLDPSPSYLCGDANADAAVDISDAVYLIAYIFSGGSAPNPVLAGDANCDSTVDISDVVYLIAYIFSGGQAPCALCK
ncbi:MAG: hypothetical protein E4G91_02930 [Candidatus Zixiibacteriota bacterium]|nr:MAG: hypothetical protein E4G91_02930 [candidate division Zixibacteria bacterium]